MNKASIYHAKALAYIDLKDYKKAIPSLNQAIEHDEQFLSSYLKLMHTSQLNGDNKETASTFKMMLKAFGFTWDKDNEFSNRLIGLLLELIEYPEAAIEHYNSILGLDTDSDNKLNCL